MLSYTCGLPAFVAPPHEVVATMEEEERRQLIELLESHEAVVAVAMVATAPEVAGISVSPELIVAEVTKVAGRSRAHRDREANYGGEGDSGKGCETRHVLCPPMDARLLPQIG